MNFAPELDHPLKTELRRQRSLGSPGLFLSVPAQCSSRADCCFKQTEIVGSQRPGKATTVTKCPLISAGVLRELMCIDRYGLTDEPHGVLCVCEGIACDCAPLQSVAPPQPRHAAHGGNRSVALESDLDWNANLIRLFGAPFSGTGR
jgi:hypothetical protein